MAATSDCCFYASALNAYIHSSSLAVRPFVCGCESSEDGVCSEPVLRGLFAADQDLLLKGATNNRQEWHGLKQHTRRPRSASPAELQGQWQAPQQEQNQEEQAALDMQPEQQEQLLQLRLTPSAKQRLPSHQEPVPPVVTLRQPSSSTADTASTCCSGCCCCCSGAECSSEPYGGEPGTECGSAGSFSQECRQHQQESRHDVCSASTAGSGPLGNSPDDVSAQKAAAQAQYALQQQQHGTQTVASLGDDMPFSTELLLQEESRLLQQDLVSRVFWLLLSCNLLFGLMVLVAKGPLAKLVAGTPAQWPILLCLSGCLAWLFMAKWRPLHFADPALEQQYAARYQAGRYLLDVWFNLAGCAGIVAAVRGDGAAAKHLASMHMPLQHVAGLPAVPLHQMLPAVFLAATLLAAIVLLLSAPNVYRHWREQLLFVGKVAMVCSLVAVQTTQDPSSVQGLAQPQQQPWLAIVGYHRPHMQVASVLLAMGAVQAFLLLTLMVRVSAYVPMQLLHMTVLLVTVANSGSSGLGMVLYALQLLSCGLCLPACVLVHLEVSARSAFLLCQQNLACCSASSMDKLPSGQCATTCHK